MTRPTAWLITATVALAVACFRSDSFHDPAGVRLEMLERAHSLRISRPLEAADLLHQAGEGPLLERYRFSLWFECLLRGAADADRWRRLLDAGPPPEQQPRVLLELGRSLLLARQGTHERRLAGTVAADEPGLVARVQREGGPFEQHPGPDVDLQIAHDEHLAEGTDPAPTARAPCGR